MGVLRRRRFMQLAAASGLLTSLPAACRPAARPPTDESAINSGTPFDWRRFAGTEIALLLDDHPWTTGLQPHLPEFEALTGITLKTRIVAEPEYFIEMEATLRASPMSADAFFLPMDSTAYRLWGDDLLLPLTPFINDPTLTAAGYNLFDFPEGFRLAAMYPPASDDQQLYGIPATFEAYILFYNKRLVSQLLAGQVPQTMAELVQAASQINKSGRAFGAVMRGVSSDAIIDTVTGIVLNGWGTDSTSLPFNLWFDGDWQKPRLTDPRIVEGLTTYARLMQAGPPDIKQMDWPEATQLFQAGKAAFYIDASLFGPDFEDDTSAIAGQVGYTVLPRVHRQSLTGHWLWGLGIPQRSSRPQAAWLFIQWATSPKMEAKIAVATGGAPRFSSWLTPSVYTEAINFDYALAVQTAMQTSRPTVVLHPRWNQMALAIAATIHQIYDGAEPKLAVDQLQTTVVQLIAQVEGSP
ncbi:extracellular solute-binding protein [Nodosilinea sp. LEGE 06152]|uniref:ABC transporter substrate-binding protein n=1 Tax=Nodosilinea sp. LEGE 06152 TaxID=2777966 RepID=UPI0018810E6E|nr:extracellular solute-binding protein [Nodosilinea sp. LEGE 06152]MBE9155955.1 extracellular solute-binding protein [Nodosilinea sp. LEGE 06152]